METNNPFNDTIDNFNKAKNIIDEETRKQDDTVEDVTKETDENNHPAYVLYNAIANNSIELLKNDTIVNTFRKLATAVGEDISKSMVEMFAILLTQSAYQAILFYDTLLKQELDNQFNHFAEHINASRADINAHHSALKVFKQQLSEIQTKLNINEIEKTHNISSDPNTH